MTLTPLTAPLLGRGDQATMRPDPPPELSALTPDMLGLERPPLGAICETASPSCKRMQVQRPHKADAEAAPHLHLEAWGSNLSHSSAASGSSKLSRHVMEESSQWVSRGVGVKSEADMQVQMVKTPGGSNKLQISVEDGKSSLLSCILALVSTCVGTGLLALPFAFSTAGVEVGMAMLLVFCVLSNFSSYLLTQCCEWATVFTYEDLMVAAFGNEGAIVMGVMVVWLLLGAMTSIVVVSADVVTHLLEALALSAAGPQSGDFIWFASWLSGNLHTLVMMTNVFFVILPISWGARSPSALKSSNAIAMFCTLSALVLLSLQGLTTLSYPDAASSGAPAEDRIDSWAVLPYLGSNDMVQVLKVVPIIMLSLGCQVQVPCVYGDLQGRSMPRMKKALAGVGGLCLGAYSVVGVMGLMAVTQLQKTMAPIVAANILDSFPAWSPSAMAMRGLMAVATCAVYPMLLLPCRSTLDHLLSVAQGKHLDEQTDREEDQASRTRSVIETLAIMSATVFFGYCGGNLARVFSFTGATAGSLSCYLLPPACYIRLRRLRPEYEQRATRLQNTLSWAMLIFLVPLSCVEVVLQFVA